MKLTRIHLGLLGSVLVLGISASCKPEKGGGASTKSGADADPKETAECKKTFDGTVSFVDKLKDLNVFTTGISVPPAESKGGKAMSYDAKRRYLFCEADGCVLGGQDGAIGKPRTPFGGSFASTMASKIGKCGELYIVATDVLPRAKVEDIMKAVGKAKCNAQGVVRQAFQSPKVEPGKDIVLELRKVDDKKVGKPRSDATNAFVDGMLKKNKKQCGGLTKVFSSVAKLEGYEKYKYIDDQLESHAKSFKPCICALDGDNGKLFLQAAAFQARAFELYHYKSRPLSADVMSGKAKAAKTWYDVVSAM